VSGGFWQTCWQHDSAVQAHGHVCVLPAITSQSTEPLRADLFRVKISTHEVWVIGHAVWLRRQRGWQREFKPACKLAGGLPSELLPLVDRWNSWQKECQSVCRLVRSHVWRGLETRCALGASQYELRRNTFVGDTPPPILLYPVMS